MASSLFTTGGEDPVLAPIPELIQALFTKPELTGIPIVQSGDIALLYSDGLVEAHNPQGEMFGFPRLRGLVAEHDEEWSLVDSLLEELYSFTEESWEQEDDITFLTLPRSTLLS
jgi:hypothetical protein